MIDVRLKKPSLYLLEEEGNSVTAEKSKNPSQDEDGDEPMITLESKKLLESSQKEDDHGEDSKLLIGIGLKISLDSLEKDEEGHSPMMVDLDSLVHLTTAMEPRRSSRNAGLKNKPSLMSVAPPKFPSAKRKPPLKKDGILLHASVEIYSAAKANQLLFRVTQRTKGRSSLMLGRQR